MRARAAKDHLHSAADFADLGNGGADAFVRMVRLAGNLLAARQDRFNIVELHGRSAALVSLHDAGDHLADHLGVFVMQSVALRLANFLNHHLFGGLSADPADGFFRIDGGAVMSTADRTVLAVDVDDDFFFFAVLLLCSRYQGRFNTLEDDFFVDILVAMDRVDDSQYFVWIHSRCLLPASRGSKVQIVGRVGKPSLALAAAEQHPELIDPSSPSCPQLILRRRLNLGRRCHVPPSSRSLCIVRPAARLKRAACLALLQCTGRLPSRGSLQVYQNRAGAP